MLFLTTELPWPASGGGRVRTVGQLRLLAALPEVQRVRVVAVSEERDEAAREAARRGLEAATGCSVAAPAFHPVHVRQHPLFVPRLLWNRVRHRTPYVAAKWDAPGLRRHIERELAAAPYDVVVLDHLGMAVYLGAVRRLQPTARVVLDQHNVESSFFEQWSARRPNLVMAEEARAARAYEEEALRAVDAVVAISAADAATFHAMAGVEPFLVPPVVPCVRRPFVAKGSDAVCFVGALGWAPNAAGVAWLVERVWPEVRRLAPGMRLLVAGRGASPQLAAPDVEVLGFVDDLDPVYARSFAMVAPVVGGAGVRIKLLEGMRAGLPLVTNRDGAAGSPIVDGREALVVDEPRAFAERLVALGRDLDLQRRLRDAAYDVLERDHAPTVCAAALRRAIGSELAEGAIAW